MFESDNLGRRLSVASDPGSDSSGSYTDTRMEQLRLIRRRRSKEMAHSVELGGVREQIRRVSLSRGPAPKEELF